MSEKMIEDTTMRNAFFTMVRKPNCTGTMRAKTRNMKKFSRKANTQFARMV